MHPRATVCLGSIILACSAAGIGACGSATVSDLPGPAEPPRSPIMDRQPAGSSFAIGHGPEGIVAHDGLAAVAMRDPDLLALIDLDQRRVAKQLPLPGAARHLGLRGNTVLVPAERADRYLSVRLPDGRASASSRTGAFPHDAVAVRGGVVVSDERGDSLTKINDDGTITTVKAASQPGGLTALRDGALLLSVSVRERAVEIFDGASLTRLFRFPTGVGPTHAACRPLGPCFVLDTRGNSLLVVRIAPDGRDARVTRRVFLPGGPYGVALDEQRERLWITSPGTNTLTELSAGARPRILRQWPTVRQPDSVAVDERTGAVLVTGRTEGVLQRVDPTTDPSRP